MIVLIFLVLLALLSTNASATTTDDALNAEYQKALTSGSIASTPLRRDSLRWTEQQWITYRDAEADLQAWIAGKTHPNEDARKVALDALTKARTAELERIAVDGTSGDISKPATMGSDNGVAVSVDAVAMVQTYATLKDALINRHNPDLLAALILSQKAWLTFSDLQAGDDLTARGSTDPDMPDSMREAAAARLDRLRVAQLLADATAIGLSLKPASSTNVEGNLDLFSEVSPDHSLRIEQGDKGEAWVISNTTGDKVELPQHQDEVGVDRDNPTVLLSEYAISPDNNWIFRTQKFYHGMCGAYLYRKEFGLNYRAATGEPFDILAWKFFERTAHLKLPDVKNGGVVRFLKWHRGQLRFSLNAKDTFNSGWIADWQADYDLTKGTFSIPADLREHNRQAVSQ